MQQDIQIHIGHDAIEKLTDYCKTLDTQRFTIVADTNTYPALGERIEAALGSAGLDVTTIVLTGDEVVADEKYLMRTLVQAPPGDQVFVAVGSGTITDITRYVSFRTRNPFISTPTAASVDGFVSVGAPLVVGGVKETYKSQGPIAVFGDLGCLMDAPAELRAAGFGDIVGKTTSLADWRLGQLLWEEPYDQAVADQTRRALTSCLDATDDVASGSEAGIHRLLDGLLESGLAMLALGNSRPASGSEHHCSHFWEMQLLKEGKPAILHGAKVGYAATLIAKLYDKIRQLGQDDARQLAQNTPFRKPEDVIAEIKHVYGPVADDIIRIQQPFLDLTEQDYNRLQARIVEHWSDIQDIAASVLPAETVLEVLERVGGPTDWRTLGLSEAMVEPALLYGHHIRNRFTVIKLCKMLGIDVSVEV